MYEFVNICEKEFYTNWNGGAVINFKWKKFGKKPVLASSNFNCFQVFHLLFELRQFIWSPKKYFLSIWNLFDLDAYFSATITIIYWIKYDYTPNWTPSISCLLLELKFLLFFRAFEYFGVYFAIIFGVAKPPNPKDPNNPWTLSNTYQVDENGTVLNETFI
ncbi:hypothetical protein C1645_840046 [Glomus cerebriforme]|uniref:Ion transport domain-containing protein n=1 Tax=Glomus cerebriforme TaxID=658196 RepID=A0A397S4T8_9GLOM|nr:hypothetical protein C1645_840046 [Glomus cerebriforme]